MRLIDADAAYKAACEGADNWDGGCSPYRDDCIREEMDKVPTVNPWHRVEEELPEEDVEVLISYRYKEGEGDTSHVDIDITSYGQMYFGGREVAGVKHWRPPFEYFSSNYEVIAWMPLPEPPKEVQE